MKVKLLKKIRKRYSITHYPNGGYFDGDWIGEPWTLLWDNQDSWRWKIKYGSREEGYEWAYEKLLIWIENDYHTSRKRKNYKIETLWYK